MSFDVPVPLLDAFAVGNPRPARLLTMVVRGETIQIADTLLDIGSFRANPGFISSALTQEGDGRIPAIEFFMAVGDNLPLTPFDVFGGFLKGAPVELAVIDRVAPLSDLIVFRGNVGSVTTTDYGWARIEARGRIARARPLMTPILGPICRNQLFGFGCFLDPDDWEETGTVGAVLTNQSLTVSISGSHVNGRFNLGQIEFTGGPCQGITRHIRLWDSATDKLSLAQPLPAMPEVGDPFNIWPGCNKIVHDLDHGCMSFDNWLNADAEPSLTSNSFIVSPIPVPVEEEEVEETVDPPRRIMWVAI